MGKKADAEIATLRKQVEVLTAEVAALRAVPWWQQPGGGVWAGPCTCGTTAANCPQHPRSWPGNVWAGLQATACAGAAPVPQVITINPSGEPLTFTRDLTMAAAGCPPAQVFTVAV